MIIAAMSIKGGVGKSTTIATLARLMASRRPVVLDTDRVQSISRFSLKGVTVQDCPPEGIDAALSQVLAKRRRLVFIDCPPDVDGSAQAILAADLIVLPSAPSSVELERTLELLEKLSRYKPSKVLFTRYRAPYRGTFEATFEAYPSKVFKTRINHSNAITDAGHNGLTILDYAPDSIAARQYIRLGQEIMGYAEQAKDKA